MNGSSRFISIQVLRAFAALAVVVDHIGLYFASLELPANNFPRFYIGASGVDLFFVISGFIMVYNSEPLFGKRSSPAKFWVRRVIRIVPLYWTVTTVFILFHLLHANDPKLQDLNWQNVVGSYFFLSLPRPSGSVIPIIAVGWTLNFEMFFYAIFAAATLLSRRAALASVTALFGVLVSVPWLLGIELPYPFADWVNPIIFEFAFGMWIAAAFQEGLRVPRWFSFVLIGAGLALLIHADQNDFAVVGRAIGWGGGAALIVAGVALANVEPTTSRIWLKMALLGDASYALYLTHANTPGLMRWTERFINPAMGQWLYAAILLGVAVVIAILVHRFFDGVVTNHLRQKAKFSSILVLDQSA